MTELKKIREKILMKEKVEGKQKKQKKINKKRVL